MSLVFVLVLLVVPAASADQRPTFALVETDKELAPLADLLTAQLSQKGVQLVERKQLDAVLQEQALSAAGLTDRATLVKIGALVRADAFVLLSLERGETANAPEQLRVRVPETHHGVRLMDVLQPWDKRKGEETAGELAVRVKALAQKLALPPGQLTPVGILEPWYYRWSDPALQALTDRIKTVLSVRLSSDPHVVVLEREDLDLLVQEKVLTAGEKGGFLGSTVLLEGMLQRSAPLPGSTLMITLLLPPGNKYLALVTVPVDEQAPEAAADDAAKQVLTKLATAPRASAADVVHEAAEFYSKGAGMWDRNRMGEAVQLLQTAHALAPDNVEYAAKLHAVAFASSFRTRDWKTADSELSVLEECLDPLIRAGDTDKLVAVAAALAVQMAAGPFASAAALLDGDVEAAGRWYSLMSRMVEVLKPYKDGTAERNAAAGLEAAVRTMGDTVRLRVQQLETQRNSLEKAGRASRAGPAKKLIERYRQAFAFLKEAPAAGGVRVRMLLTGKEWPLAWEWRANTGLPYARVRCEGGRIWLALTDIRQWKSTRTVAVAGLDPAGKEPPVRWQAQVEGSEVYFSRMVGFVLGERHSYVALDYLGVVVFPGTQATGQGVLSTPQVLGGKDGLPPVPPSAIGGTPTEMWVSFGTTKSGSGLGLYDAETGAWKPYLSAPPLPRRTGPIGEFYGFKEIIPAGNGVLLYGINGGADAVSEFDPASGKLTRLASAGVVELSAGPEDGFWLKSTYSLTRVDPRNKVFELAVYGRAAGQYKDSLRSGWSLRTFTFAPPGGHTAAGSLRDGRIDLTTAAIHGDQMWARCGQSQLAILKRGQVLEDARKIDNNILDGGPVLQFFDTPYGLLAVGKGSVGIVDTEE